MLVRIVMVTAFALSVLLFGAPEDAVACHKGDPGIPHGGAASCYGGGGGGTTTLGDLNCTADQIAKFNDSSEAWECALDETGGDSFVVVDSTGQIIRHTRIDRNLRSASVAINKQSAR